MNAAQKAGAVALGVIGLATAPVDAASVHNAPNYSETHDSSVDNAATVEGAKTEESVSKAEESSGEEQTTSEDK